MGFTRPSCLHDAGELLPHHFNLTTALPVSAECFCCTFPIVTYAGRYPASLPCGARTFLMPKARDRLVYPHNLIIISYFCEKTRFYFDAIHSTSTSPPFGSVETSTHERAGFVSLKYFAYISFTFAKLFISVIKTVVFTTSE